jgi:hypothetical protein
MTEMSSASDSNTASGGPGSDNDGDRACALEATHLDQTMLLEGCFIHPGSLQFPFDAGISQLHAAYSKEFS